MNSTGKTFAGAPARASSWTDLSGLMCTEFLIVAECVDQSTGKKFFAEYSVAEVSADEAKTRLKVFLEKARCSLVKLESCEVFAENTDLEPSVEQMTGRTYFNED